jgi:hypothetical protein
MNPPQAHKRKLIFFDIPSFAVGGARSAKVASRAWARTLKFQGRAKSPGECQGD